MSVPYGRLRPLRYRDDIPALLPLLRETFLVDDAPHVRLGLQRFHEAVGHAPPGSTTEGQVLRGRVPFFGWVWEHAGQPLGLVALTPMSQRPRRYVLANIVVHPRHRGRGIGRALVQQALRYVAARGGEAWLEVYADNHPAVGLYTSLGFRTCWRGVEWRWRPADAPRSAPVPHLQVRPARRQDWPHILRWLYAVYPRWMLWRWPPQPLDRALHPGWRGRLWRWWHQVEPGDLWVVERQGQCRGLWAWWPEPDEAQTMFYLFAAADLTPDELRAGMQRLQRHNFHLWNFDPQSGRMVAFRPMFYLTLPPGRHGAALRQLGWNPASEVLWMRHGGCPHEPSRR